MEPQDPYQQVANETKAGQVDEPLWIRSIAESGGDDAKARSLYLKFRVEKVDNIFREAAATEHRQAEIAKRIVREAARAVEKASPPSGYGIAMAYAVFCIAVGLFNLLGFFGSTGWERTELGFDFSVYFGTGVLLLRRLRIAYPALFAGFAPIALGSGSTRTRFGPSASSDGHFRNDRLHEGTEASLARILNGDAGFQIRALPKITYRINKGDGRTSRAARDLKLGHYRATGWRGNKGCNPRAFCALIKTG
jgi:hypothetical protein